MRQGKDQMIVGCRQQFSSAGLEPSGLGQRLAFGTVSIAAGVVQGLPAAAGIALLNVSAKIHGAEQNNIMYSFLMVGRQPILLQVLQTVTSVDIGQLPGRSALMQRLTHIRVLFFCMHAMSSYFGSVLSGSASRSSGLRVDDSFF